MQTFRCVALLAASCGLLLACGPSRPPGHAHPAQVHADSDTSARVRPIELPRPASADSLLKTPNPR